MTKQPSDVPVNPNDLPQRSNLSPYLKQKTLIQWKDGQPIPYTEWVLPKNQIDQIFLAALALPYAGTIDPRNPDDILVEPEFDGLTNIEVACIKTARKAAAGDTEALKFTVERLIGKPKLQVEQTNINISLTEFLSNLNLQQEAQIWDTKLEQVTKTENRWDI